ncbi:MAG: hypothetical protein JJT75_07080 [Opitutales bacterium]|nr:hypothetical protein [Opitutales bacterium]MCH8540298.1 hypothetical protein [Opitutales bacterium]
MKRLVEDEKLDSLPENDPEAIRNRRDLRLINFFQGNYRWLGRQMKKHLLPREQGAEWGAGAGDLGKYLAENNLLPEDVRIDGWDAWSRPVMWPRDWGWEQRDFTTIDRIPYDFLVGNLIFHQFEDEILAHWGKLINQSCRLVLACEPVRRSLHLWQLELLRPFRLSPVSWHDARVSIRAGFRGAELPSKLGLSPELWDCQIHETFLGSYRFRAQRKGDVPLGQTMSEGAPA